MVNFYREYYFSEENLMRDFFLRRKMDAQGFLPITLIASFHRVQALTTDVALVIESITESDKLEMVEGFKVSYYFFSSKILYSLFFGRSFLIYFHSVIFSLSFIVSLILSFTFCPFHCFNFHFLFLSFFTFFCSFFLSVIFYLI